MYNLIAYFIYTLSITGIIYWVGHYLYKYGQVFIERYVSGDLEFSRWINRLLLTGFYLLNLGAGIYAVSTWAVLYTFIDLIGSLLFYLSRLIVLLGVMHYLNMFIIYKSIQQFSKTKN